MATANYETLSLKNLFSFKCPIFDAEVQMRSCVHLRDQVYMGKTVGVRRGCQACIQSSKCPAAELVRRIALNTGDATDHCASSEAKVGRLPADILERIAPVIVQEQHLATYGVPTAERQLIASARERIEAQAATAPRGRVEAKVIRASSVSAPTKREIKVTTTAAVAPAPKTDSIHEAAMSGDLAAAINS